MEQGIRCLVIRVLVLVVAAESARLAHYNVNENQISVSGLSSGAYFAVQFHVAFSKTVMGAGIVAGGPFWCAEDNALIAQSSCMKAPEGISVSSLVQITYTTALSFTIDNPSNMKDHRVFLFSGQKDTIVVQGVMKKLEDYYSHFTKGIETQFSIPAEHAMVTDGYGNSCNHLGSPFINNCKYSTAYHILQHIYGDIKTNLSSPAKPENLLEFEQSEFFSDVPGALSMDATGFVYVPSACRDGNKECRLHIAFHGCKQGRNYVNNVFALHAGYNDIAEENNIIILYPQATNSTTVPLNPYGCWDWWGYTAPSYASKLGPQMVGVKQMLDRVSSKDIF